MLRELLVKKLREDAILPKRATEGSAGYDLCASISEEREIAPGETVKIGTGIALGLQTNRYAVLIYARSGLASKFGIAPANCVGVVDSDYRGEVIVPLHNHGKEPFVVHPGDRIAQMVIAPVELPELLEVENLDETQRGFGGFGSTLI